MSLFHYSAREIHCKIVYYGPGLGGKTTNLRVVHERAPKSATGQLVSISTENDRTLFFDFMPLDLGEVRGFKVRFHLYTVPGQHIYAASRRLILRGADAVIFVVDSQVARLEESRRSYHDLAKNLKSHGLRPKTIPMVLQYNKRDLEHVVPVWELERIFNVRHVPSFEAVASEGRGVLETLKACCKDVVKRLEVPAPQSVPAQRQAAHP